MDEHFEIIGYWQDVDEEEKHFFCHTEKDFQKWWVETGRPLERLNREEIEWFYNQEFLNDYILRDCQCDCIVRCFIYWLTPGFDC